jgi:adenosylcobinamide-GDP ribazoletransferase
VKSPIEELSALALTFAFFTRLPLPVSWLGTQDRREKLHEAVIWFPVAGFLIGALPALFYWVAAGHAPAPVAAGLAIGLGIFITGALHEDGFADCADGLGGADDRERSLSIMRDPRLGVYGGIALLFSVGLRWAALASLPPAAGAAALLIAHSAGRGAIASALAFSSYARPQGTGSIVAAGISRSRWLLTMVVTLLLGALAGAIPGVFAAVAGILAAAFFLLRFEWRLGGYTGDTLGGMEQAAEITVLALLAAIWGDIR